MGADPAPAQRGGCDNGFSGKFQDTKVNSVVTILHLNSLAYCFDLCAFILTRLKPATRQASVHCNHTEPTMETLTALAAARAAHPQAPAAGSDAEAAALKTFATFFSSFASDRVDQLLDSTYSPDVYFNDTLKSIRGSAALAHYLKESAAAVEDCRVTIEDATRTVDGDYLLRWKMMIRFKKLRRGVDTWTVGMSHLRFDAAGRVAYHQDYWNAADGIYEHVPVLGWMIRALKKRL